MADNLPSSTLSPILSSSKSCKALHTSSFAEELPAELPEITWANMEMSMDSESENEDEKRFLEEWRAHVQDEEYEEMSDLRKTWQKELENVVDLEEYMTARMDEDDDGDDDEVEVEFEGRERILAWMDCGDEAEEEDMDKILHGDEEEEGTWLNGNGEVAEVPQLIKIVQTIGKKTPDFAAACHKTALNPAYPWVSGLNPMTALTESQLTGTAWALGRLETVQGAILADAEGLGKKLTALSVIMAQNNDRAAGKTLWGDAKPTLIVTSVESVEAWVDMVKVQFDDVGYHIHHSKSTLNGKHLNKYSVVKHVQEMKDAQKGPTMLIYVVDGDLILGCPDLSGCFGLKIIDEPGYLHDEETDLWKAVKAIGSPFTLLLTSTPPSTKRGLSAHLELINPDSEWNRLGVPYHENPFNFSDDDPRAVLRATKRAVENHLGSGLEKEKNFQKIYELVMLRREEFEVEISSSEGSHYEDLDDIEMLPNTAIMQSIEVVEKVLNAALNPAAVANPRKRQADEEAALPRGKKVRRDQSTIFQQHTSPEERDATIPVGEPTGVISSVWRYFQSWK